MAFPRQFNNQVWYLQIPSGEIEIATSEALKSAYKCGLVDLRTPVRAFGTHAWQSMQEAAEIELPSEPSIASLTPVAMSAPPPELDVAITRASRVDIEPAAFVKPSRRPAILTAVAALACLVGVAFTKSDAVKKAAASAQLTDEMAPVATVAMPAKPVHQPVREQLFSASRYDDEPKFTKAQKWKLQNLDFITRTQRPKSATFKTMTQKPLPGMPKSEEPFSKSTIKGDPLDGTL